MDNIEFLKKVLAEQEKENPKFFVEVEELSRLSTKAIKPFIDFINCSFKIDKKVTKMILISMIASLIVLYSEDYDMAYKIIDEIKKSVIQEETKFNKFD